MRHRLELAGPSVSSNNRRRDVFNAKVLENPRFVKPPINRNLCRSIWVLLYDLVLGNDPVFIRAARPEQKRFVVDDLHLLPRCLFLISTVCFNATHAQVATCRSAAIF